MARNPKSFQRRNLGPGHPRGIGRMEGFVANGPVVYMSDPCPLGATGQPMFRVGNWSSDLIRRYGGNREHISQIQVSGVMSASSISSLIGFFISQSKESIVSAYGVEHAISVSPRQTPPTTYLGYTTECQSLVRVTSNSLCSNPAHVAKDENPRPPMTGKLPLSSASLSYGK